MKTAREYLCDALRVDDRRLTELLQDEYRPPKPYLPDILKAITNYGLDVREETAKVCEELAERHPEDGMVLLAASIAVRSLPLGDKRPRVNK